MKKQKENIAYDVKLNDLWLWLKCEKFLANFKRPSEEVVQKKVDEAFKKTTSKVNLICESFIDIHRGLIIDAYLNGNKGANVNERKDEFAEDANNVSIVKRKKQELANAQAEAEKAAKQKERIENSASFETYANELTNLINGFFDKAASYVSGYIGNIEKKNPEVTSNLSNPFDSFEFDINDFNIVIGGVVNV